MVITGMFAAACLILTAIVCRIAFRLGNKQMHSLRAQRLRLRGAWAFNFAVWAACCWVVVAYGRCLRREDTNPNPNPTLTLTLTLTLILTLTLP
jgi:amino acid permease